MMLRLIKRLKRDRRGVAALEFALALPLLTLLVFGAVEVSRYVLAAQAVNNVARSMADLASQGKTMTNAELNSLFAAVKYVAQPFDMQAGGKVFVSSLSKTGVSPTVMNWQESRGDLTGVSSLIGTPGSSPALPTGFAVTNGYTVVAVEAYYDFSPLLIDFIIPSQRLYRAAFFRARLGALTSLSS